MEDLPMGRMISKKLRSSKGASLTFALLAFLVCAVISAVLLASASAATGRLSNLAETDQRYYAVTSAAQLFCDTLENNTYEVERVWTETIVTARKYIEVNGIVVAFVVGDPVGTLPAPIAASLNNETLNNAYAITLKAPGADYQTNDKEKTSDETKNDIAGWRDISLFADAALSYVIGNDSVDALDAYRKKPGSAAIADAGDSETAGDLRTIKKWDLKLEFDPEDQYLGIPILATLSLRNDGSMLVEVWNDSTTDYFKVTVTLTATVIDNSALPEVSTREDVYWKNDVLEGEGANQLPYNYETKVTTTERTKTTTIKWDVTDIKKGAA